MATFIHDGWVALTEDEAAELAELRRRIYGPDSTVEITAGDVDRLRSLEGDGGESTDVRERTPDDQTNADPAGAGASPPVTLRSAARGTWRWWLGAAVAGVALAAVGYGIGVLSTTSKAPEAIPEFAFDQTDEDLLPETFLAENDGLNPASTRFVGRIDGYDIYLAQNTQLNGVCIVALTDSVQPEFASMGCSGDSLTTGGLGSGVSENLVIEVGEMRPESRGTPVRMSENVTAYRT